MSEVIIVFGSELGRVKPMNAVNNGPVKPEGEQTRGNFDAFRRARIPVVRNHDASFCSSYGGEHSVDVHAVFPDFSKDPYDPASYDFTLTDDYTRTILDAGSEVFYRLGSKIEHARKKYGTVMPPDFKKWAVICEHIIRHYNEGWADGFRWNIRYWEIWNEPDGVAANGDQPNWTGTKRDFFDLYKVAAKHLKKCFPDLRIGGPAISWLHNDEGRWFDDFLKSLSEDGDKTPCDFIGWHVYTDDPHFVAEQAQEARMKLDRAGYTETESYLDEYNYLENWTDRFVSSIKAIIGMRGAAFTAASMAVGQYSPVDMLMYYDARPSTVFNGLFEFYTFEPLPGYWPFLMFSGLYKLGTCVSATSDDPNIYAVAAKGKSGRAVMITHYRQDNTSVSMLINLCVSEPISGIIRGRLLSGECSPREVDLSFADGRCNLVLPENSVLLIEYE